jgi:hypothetical protein
MGKAGFILGIIAIIAMCVGFVPCFGWSFWFTLPLAFVGFVLSLIGVINSDPAYAQQKSQASIGMVLNIVTLVLGFIRWAIGGFIL